MLPVDEGGWVKAEVSHVKMFTLYKSGVGPDSYHEEGGVICVGGASGGVYILNTHMTKTDMSKTHSMR